jgi:zinc transporter ZupT
MATNHLGFRQSLHNIPEGLAVGVLWWSRWDSKASIAGAVTLAGVEFKFS